MRALEAEFAVAETPGCRRSRHLPRYLHRVPGTPSLLATSRGHGQDWGCSCITLCFPRHCPSCPCWARGAPEAGQLVSGDRPALDGSHRPC